MPKNIKETDNAVFDISNNSFGKHSVYDYIVICIAANFYVSTNQMKIADLE